MKINTLKLMACGAALVVGSMSAQNVMAQSADVPVTLTTTSAITVTPGDTMDFGEWFMQPVNDDLVTLVLNPQDGSIISATDNGVDTTDDGSQVVDIGLTSAAGTVEVTTPAAATVSVYGTITDIADPQLEISTPRFSVNAGTPAALSEIMGTPSTFSSTGGTPDTISVGATITATETAGVGPADNNHTGNIELTFSY